MKCQFIDRLAYQPFFITDAFFDQPVRNVGFKKRETENNKIETENKKCETENCKIVILKMKNELFQIFITIKLFKILKNYNCNL